MRSNPLIRACLAALTLAAALGGCATPPRSPLDTSSDLRVPTPAVEHALRKILVERRIVTAGLGIIVDSELAWSLYHGDASPGVPAGAGTRFNVASITKMVTAQTALRLVEAGQLDLDEPLATYWVDPDVEADARLSSLTARTVLTHTTGFPNWRFFRSDGKLAFTRAPGEAYGYSGEGFEYLARAIANKLGKPFPQVVQEWVFDPDDMQGAMLEVQREGLHDVASAIDEQDVAHPAWCRPGGMCRDEGSYSAADDMLMSVPDHARFLAMLARDASRTTDTLLARDRVHVQSGDDPVVDCDDPAIARCPHAQGYGLGFRVIEVDATRIVGHGGNDWSEVALGYVELPLRNGVIVFLNAPNRRGLEAMPLILELLDPDSPFPGQYRRWLARERAQASR